MLKEFFNNKKWRSWSYGGGLLLLALLCVQVYLAFMMNNWHKEFFDMVEFGTQHTAEEWKNGIIKFLWIVGFLNLTYVMIDFLKNVYGLRWREATTFYYLPLWKNVKRDVENANQRIQEDVYEFAKIIAALGIQVFEAIISLIVFIPILWKLNSQINITFIKSTPGFLLWLALVAGIIGTIISRFVGKKLPELEYERQKTEANYRAELVMAERMGTDKYASMGKITELFREVLKINLILFLYQAFFGLWRNSYAQLMVILPFMVLGQGILAGLITWGTLIQTNDALCTVRMRFSFFIDNWTTITTLMSVRKRLCEFECNLRKYNPK